MFGGTRDAKTNPKWRPKPPPELASVFLFLRCGNDPSAGSPTETLLRLHLPLNVEV